MVGVNIVISGTNLVAKILLKEIRLLDYFRREQQPRAFSRAINNPSRAYRDFSEDKYGAGGGRISV